MSENHQSRRHFLGSLTGKGLALATSASWLPLVAGCAGPGNGPVQPVNSALQPTIDPTTGMSLLALPEGFRYFSFGWRNQALSDGSAMPGNADGMGIVAEAGNRVTLVRNHELWDPGALISPDRPVYDPGAAGGTVLLEVDLDKSALVRAEALLVGTVANCSGGVLPGGRWLSCEELVHDPANPGTTFDGKPLTAFQKSHGFVFEGGPGSSPMPILGMGQMRHEGIAVDPRDNAIYLTEDRSGEAGLYRFQPQNIADLQAGGTLMMLAVQGRKTLTRGAKTGQRLKTFWVQIADPLRGHNPGTQDSGGVVSQGLGAGGCAFTRLEGLFYRDGVIYFNATDGGAAGAGQVFAYYPERNEVELIYESPGIEIMDYPDQMCGDLAGGVLICQDSKRVETQSLWWLAPNGKLKTLAQNNVEIGGRSYRQAEWSGVCMSADRQWLFANIYTPGFTVAINGPFESWASGA